jgi:hypothetical protein
MIYSKLQEYVFYKYWVIRITDWDEWQKAIRSHLFKNPIRK